MGSVPCLRVSLHSQTWEGLLALEGLDNGPAAAKKKKKKEEKEAPITTTLSMRLQPLQHYPDNRRYLLFFLMCNWASF